MPELPVSGVFHVSDYSGMGGFHWRPPLESLELGASRSCTMKSPSGSSNCTLLPGASGKFSGTYDIGGRKGQLEVEPQADGSLKVEFFNQSFSGWGNSRPGGVVVQARKGAPTIHSGQPSLLDKTRFFPAVLGNREFREKGVLFGEEPTIARDCKWVVVDPNRHKLRVWEKPTPMSDFVTAGQALRASVFTNGPMVHARTDGNKYLLGAKYYGKATVNYLWWRLPRGPIGQMPWDTAKAINEASSKAADDVFEGPPYGDVFSFSNQIDARVPQNLQDVNLGHFGRGLGTDFDSYTVGSGNPVGLAEASGGLYPPAILNYVVTPDTHGSNQWFYWGLAPLKPTGTDEVGLKNALAAYASIGSPRPLNGLIIGLFYHGGRGDVVQHLADVSVRDAVKLDGSDSVLLGHDSTIEWGDGMTAYKRIWMRWGFAFYPQ